MSRYTEGEIAIEAVKVVEEYGEVAMGELIDILTERMQPSGYDVKILKNRNDTFFSQRVRNLRSHQNKIFFNNVFYDSKIDKYVSLEFRKIKFNLDDDSYNEILEKRRNRTISFYARKLDFERINKERKLIGNAGENFVFEDQIRFVNEHVPEFVNYVRNVSKSDGDGAGYDIYSFDEHKKIMYIEVKTTTGEKKTPFYMTASEYAFFELHRDNYVIARVYEFDLDKMTGKIEYIPGICFESVFDREISAYKIFYKN